MDAGLSLNGQKGSRSEPFVLVYDDTPKSLNAGGTGSRRHWSVGHKEKKRWEGVWAMLLLARRVPRGMAKCYVEARLEYPDARRRDVENFRSALSKPLADALVKGGWLADDTEAFFELGRVNIVSGVEDLPQKSRTTVTIEAEYE